MPKKTNTLKKKIMTGQTRYTILFDRSIYFAGKRKATQVMGMKMYQYLNMLVAKDTGTALPNVLKHRTTKKK